MTTTPSLGLELQTTGSNNNTWGEKINDILTTIDAAIAGIVSVSTTGGSTVLSAAQNKNAIIALSGTLASNATIVVQDESKIWTVINATTGSFNVTVKTASGTGVLIPRGPATVVYTNGTNVLPLRPAQVPHSAAAGTANAITATFKPETQSGELQNGFMWLVEASAANTTTTPTFAPDGLGPFTIVKNIADPLDPGDIAGAGHWILLNYDQTAGKVILMNPFQGRTARATCRYKGNTDTITGNYNLGTVTKNGTGDYTFTFDTPMPDNQYNVSAVAEGDSSNVVIVSLHPTTSPTSNLFRLKCISITQESATPETAMFDPPVLMVTVTR